jgi:hypothetical protein
VALAKKSARFARRRYKQPPDAIHHLQRMTASGASLVEPEALSRNWVVEPMAALIVAARKLCRCCRKIAMSLTDRL